MNVSRRRYMGASNEEPPLYWWDSEDALSNVSDVSYWIDRIKGVPAQATNYNKVDGMYELQINDYTPNRVFELSNLNSGNTKIVLPAAWKCVCEFKVPSDMVSKLGGCYIFDFGALGAASHAFALVYYPSSGKCNVLYKPVGNDSNYTLSSSPQVETDKIIKIEFGTYYTSSTSVRLYLKYNNDIYYGKAEHNAVAYNGNWWSTKGIFGAGNNQGYCGGRCYLKSLKFYKNE